MRELPLSEFQDLKPGTMIVGKDAPISAKVDSTAVIAELLEVARAKGASEYALRPVRTGESIATGERFKRYDIFAR